jgi:hypothetical protein
VKIIFCSVVFGKMQKICLKFDCFHLIFTNFQEKLSSNLYNYTKNKKELPSVLTNSIVVIY